MTILFVSLSIILGLAIAFAIAFPFIVRALYRRNARKMFGRKLYRLANINDYYLINVLKIETNDHSSFEVDHVMFGNKYIYLVKDFYQEGTLCGKMNDNSFFVRERNQYVDNPLVIAKEQVRKLAMVLNYDESLFIPIVLVNDACVFESYKENLSIIYPSFLKSTIADFESRDVDPLDADKLASAVKDIARINRRK